jgi:Metallo-peptidase family M12B Reprolysin-like
MNANFLGAAAMLSVASIVVAAFDSHQSAVMKTTEGRGYLTAQISNRGASAVTRRVMTTTVKDFSSDAALASTLSSLGYQKDQVISIHAVTFDVPLLVDAWQRVHLNGEPVRINFIGHETETRKILRSADAGKKDVRTLLFETIDNNGWVGLSINQEGDAVQGYAILDGKAYDIAPIPGGGREDGKKIHAYVELNLEDKRAASSSDFRVSNAVDSMHQAIAAPSYDCKTNRVVKVSRDLSILVGYTPESERKSANPDYGGPTAAKPLSENAQLALERALQQAGVDVRLTVLDPIEVPYAEPRHPKEPIKILDEALDALIMGNEPSMVEFRSKRKEYKADIGVLLIDMPNRDDCGEAQLSASPDNAYAVVNWKCMQGKQSFSHEVGHILGLYHQGDANAVPSYAKAFMQAGPEIRRPFITLMGAFGDCKGTTGGCARILRFSGPLQSYKNSVDSDPVVIGVPEKVDNSCVLRQTVPLVAQFGDKL